MSARRPLAARRVDLAPELRAENAEGVTGPLLAHIQRQFYADDARRFFKDRRMLLRAITWPATWLRGRGVSGPEVMPAERYRGFIMERIQDIKRFGQWERYKAYFPGYFWKCIQTWFAHNGDGLYEELKGARNTFDLAILGVQRIVSKAPTQPVVDVLAEAHALVKSRRPAKRPAKAQPQLSLL